MPGTHETISGRGLCADGAFTSELASLMRQARWGSADPDEVLASVARIDDRDADSWVSEWVWTAGEAWAEAERAASYGAVAAARARYLQAAGYYAVAPSQIDRSAEHGRAGVLWGRHRAWWEQAVRRTGTALRIEIPYEGGTLPGHFLPATASRRGPRPLVIMHNGAYGPTSALWGLGGAAAAQRDYHWMTFDGPALSSRPTRPAPRGHGPPATAWTARRHRASSPPWRDFVWRGRHHRSQARCFSSSRSGAPWQGQSSRLAEMVGGPAALSASHDVSA